MSVNEELRDRAIRHAVEMNRYSRGLSEAIIRLLNSADKEIVDKLAAGLVSIEGRGAMMTKANRDRLEKLLAEIRVLNRAVYGQLYDEMSEQLTEFAVLEGNFQRQALVASIGVDLSTRLPSPARLRAIIEETPMEGSLLKSWVEGMERARIDRISQELRKGMLQGEGVEQLVQRVRGTRKGNYQDGVMQISRRSAQAMVRTSTTHVSNIAAQHTWKANEHLIKGWQFVATLDSRTSITCSALSGQIFPIGEGPIPPRHVGCRSVSVAVTKSFKELGIDRDELPKSARASMDGKVAPDTTFSKWLNDKGEATQEKILGKTRAELFRSGKLDLAQFVKNDGTVLTLNELKERYPDIWT